MTEIDKSIEILVTQSEGSVSAPIEREIDIEPGEIFYVEKLEVKARGGDHTVTLEYHPDDGSRNLEIVEFTSSGANMEGTYEVGEYISNPGGGEYVVVHDNTDDLSRIIALWSIRKVA